MAKKFKRCKLPGCCKDVRQYPSKPSDFCCREHYRLYPRIVSGYVDYQKSTKKSTFFSILGNAPALVGK